MQRLNSASYFWYSGCACRHSIRTLQYVGFYLWTNAPIKEATHEQVKRYHFCDETWLKPVQPKNLPHTHKILAKHNSKKQTTQYHHLTFYPLENQLTCEINGDKGLRHLLLVVYVALRIHCTSEFFTYLDAKISGDGKTKWWYWRYLPKQRSPRTARSRIVIAKRISRPPTQSVPIGIEWFTTIHQREAEA